MIKKLISLTIIFFASFMPFTNVKADAANVIPLTIGWEDPDDNQENPNREPVHPPMVSIEDYTLSFDHSCLGCTLRLVDASGDVAYTTVINGDTLVLPSTLSGEYELQILFDDCYFFGFVGF